MDFKDQVTKWVENKIGEVIIKDLKEKIVTEDSSFDVETYANSILDKHFSDKGQLQKIFNQDSHEDLIYSEIEFLTEEQESSDDSLGSDSGEFQTFFEEEIIKDLESDSQEVKKKSLRILESAAEDFINQTSWNVIFDGLQKALNTTNDREIHNLVLKIFQKLLKCSKKPQVICNGFTSTAKLAAEQIFLFNSEKVEESYCPKLDKCEGRTQNILELYTRKQRNPKNPDSAYPEILIKLMWLLVDCQQQMPVKWTRFNESRYREIIFSFVHLLSATTTLESNKLSGLELLSILNPTASWCHYYCHTAVGRSLLCSALKKYKTFFTHVVEIILNYIRIKKSNRLPSIRGRVLPNKTPQKFKTDVSDTLKSSNKLANTDCKTEKHGDGLKPNYLDERSNWIRSSPVGQSGINGSENGKTKKSNSSSEREIKSIPRRVVTEAVFCHSVSFVTCLIQFRSGRALFPLHTKIRNRLVSIQDFSLCLIEYLEKTENYERDDAGITFTSKYKTRLLEIADILRRVKSRTSSSRSAKRHTFSYP